MKFQADFITSCSVTFFAHTFFFKLGHKYALLIISQIAGHFKNYYIILFSYPVTKYTFVNNKKNTKKQKKWLKCNYFYNMFGPASNGQIIIKKPGFILFYSEDFQ